MLRNTAADLDFPEILTTTTIISAPLTSVSGNINLFGTYDTFVLTEGGTYVSGTTVLVSFTDRTGQRIQIDGNLLAAGHSVGHGVLTSAETNVFVGQQGQITATSQDDGAVYGGVQAKTAAAAVNVQTNPGHITSTAGDGVVLTNGRNTINGTSNAEDNTITGNRAANLISGGAGSDPLIGGQGNDGYVIDDEDDVVIENANEGRTDTVFAGVSFALGANVEYLVLVGTDAINGTGNELSNQISGNAGNNGLEGGGGADLLNGTTGTDTLIGGTGNDTYITDGGDVIFELAGEGFDSVQSSATHTLAGEIEGLLLTGSAAINGTGNSLANFITGNSAANTLDGGLGLDTLTGGAGADSFLFRTALGTANADRINDFDAASDTIQLENAVFRGLAAGRLSAAVFVKNTSGTAADASDRIIYETDTGKLFFDRDGTGAIAKVHFATIGTGHAVTNADFFVV